VSQRDSGYERKERDCYETPAWVTAALIPHLRSLRSVWDPACGAGKMVKALAQAGIVVDGSDIASNEWSIDFFQAGADHHEGIITNPPYSHAQEFIEHALRLMRPNNGVIAMLLRTDYDHAVSRQHLFSGHKRFAKKLVLTKRIKWFENSNGQPSFNHAWFIWDWLHEGPPTLAYGP
jgi:hypothetical protein